MSPQDYTDPRRRLANSCLQARKNQRGHEGEPGVNAVACGRGRQVFFAAPPLFVAGTAGVLVGEEEPTTVFF